MFYTAAYAAMNVGAFAVVSHFAGGGERYVTLDDYAGLGRRSPLLAATLTIFLLSLIGIPDHRRLLRQVLRVQRGAAGESGRADDHRCAQQRGRRLLLPADHRGDVHAGRAGRIAGGAGLSRSRNCARHQHAATLYLGLLPGRVLEYASRSAAELLR